MKRRAFLEKIGGHYLDDFVYISWYPLYDRGFEIISFDGDDMEGTLLRHNPTIDDFILGSVQATEFFFKHIGLNIPNYLGYPESLWGYMGRNVYKTQYGLISNPYPYFVKPADGVKSFTGALIENEKTEELLRQFDGLTDDTNVWYSDPVEFITEYRCFVHNNELVGIKHYLGDFKKFIDVGVVENMIKDYTDSNCSYTLDVGLNNKGETLLVEVNDMWAIGSYGMDAKTYVRMCIDRLQEIKKQYKKNE